MTTITELRELLAKAALPPNEATAKLIRVLPKLLDLAEAAKVAMDLHNNGDPENFGRGLTRAYDNLTAAVAKLEDAQ